MQNLSLEINTTESIEPMLNQLEQTSIGNRFTKQELECLIKHAKIVQFLAPDTIIKQGEETEGLYFLVKGQVMITARIMGQEGLSQIETLGPGNFLGGTCFIEKGPCTTSAVAKEAVTCLLVTPLYFELLSACYPQINYKILVALSEQVCGRLKRMHDTVTEHITESKMVSLSFFSKVVYSFNQPSRISFEEAHLTPEQLAKKCPFEDLSKSEVDELLAHMELIEASKHCNLIYQAEKKSSCYIVIQGAVQSSIVHDNKLAKLSVIGPKTLFAGVACIDHDSSYTITFSTCEPAILLKIAEADLEYFKKNKPQLWYKLFNLICASLVALEKSVDKLGVRLHIESYNR